MGLLDFSFCYHVAIVICVNFSSSPDDSHGLNRRQQHQRVRSGTLCFRLIFHVWIYGIGFIGGLHVRDSSPAQTDNTSSDLSMVHTESISLEVNRSCPHERIAESDH